MSDLYYDTTHTNTDTAALLTEILRELTVPVRWEHCVFAPEIALSNKCGAEGWEAVGITEHANILMKRRVRSEPGGSDG